MWLSLLSCTRAMRVALRSRGPFTLEEVLRLLGEGCVEQLLVRHSVRLLAVEKLLTRTLLLEAEAALFGGAFLAGCSRASVFRPFKNVQRPYDCHRLLW